MTSPEQVQVPGPGQALAVPQEEHLQQERPAGGAAPGERGRGGQHLPEERDGRAGQHLLE